MKNPLQEEYQELKAGMMFTFNLHQSDEKLPAYYPQKLQ